MHVLSLTLFVLPEKSQEACTKEPRFLAERHMDHIFTYCATTAFVFQKMDSIKRNAEEVKKVGIQMSGLLTHVCWRIHARKDENAS